MVQNQFFAAKFCFTASSGRKPNPVTVTGFSFPVSSVSWVPVLHTISVKSGAQMAPRCSWAACVCVCFQWSARLVVLLRAPARLDASMNNNLCTGERPHSLPRHSRAIHFNEVQRQIDLSLKAERERDGQQRADCSRHRFRTTRIWIDSRLPRGVFFSFLFLRLSLTSHHVAFLTWSSHTLSSFLSLES